MPIANNNDISVFFVNILNFKIFFSCFFLSHQRFLGDKRLIRFGINIALIFDVNKTFKRDY